MKKLYLLASLVTMLSVSAGAQFVAILQAPPTGYTYKPQLWNIVVNSSSPSATLLHIELTLTSVVNAQPVLSASTKIFAVSAGTVYLTATTVAPIQYNFSSGYTVDPNPGGLLPLGEYEACYRFYKHVGDVVEQVAEQCIDITVEPLMPAQLVYPYDQTGIEERHPQFSWLPPVPMQMFTNLQYDFTLAQMNLNQSPADAVQLNPPLYQASSLSSNILLYPLSAQSLDTGKRYVWRIAVRSNGAVVGVSETWEFTIKTFEREKSLVPTDQPFVQLKKSPETAYGIFSGELKFGYNNETGDSLLRVTIKDLTTSKVIDNLHFDTVLFRRGQNLIRYELLDNNAFLDQRLYQLEITNSRGEIWRLRFQYRVPAVQNNQD